jgi:hypothetical protein
MTRRLRPPARIDVQCRPDGRPVRLRRGGRARIVTHVAASWVRPAPWWSTFEASGHDSDLPPHAAGDLNEERTYFRVVLDAALVHEIFCTSSGHWYLERIMD